MIMKGLKRQTNGDVQVIPEDLLNRFSPETLQFTLSQLEAKGMIEPVSGGYAHTKAAQDILKQKPIIRDEIIAYGHKNVEATHDTTVEITKDVALTERGDCIIAIKADKACKDLDDLLKNYLKLAQPIKITVEVNDEKDEIVAFGSPALKLTSNNSLVIRKSDFIDGRTAAILSDKSAVDLDRKLIKELKKPKPVRIKIEALG